MTDAPPAALTSSTRLCGVLQPLFSVRSARDVGIGDFGSLEGLFDWLKLANQRLLMFLPLLPTSASDTSPYATRSAFGFNVLYIHLAWLDEAPTLSPEEQVLVDAARASDRVQYEIVQRVKGAVLRRAFATFQAQGDTARSQEFASWALDNAAWLDGHALFAALSDENEQRPWWEWPSPIANREVVALASARQRLALEFRYYQWSQWVAEEQWRRVRRQAQAAGVALCGDEPFIISPDSSDCWRWPQFLRRDARLGVPPDEFSPYGQDWGLPWIDFEAMSRDGDTWLKTRASKAASYYDALRIDHAVGYFRQYLRGIDENTGRFHPADETAQRTLGERNFRMLLAPGTHIIAEDLGVVPSFVHETLAALAVPGYKVMRWARKDGVYGDSHAYPRVSVVTTGTHDTESLKSWWETAPDWERAEARRKWPEMGTLETPPREMTPDVHEALLRAAMNSSSDWCVLPWQDVLGSRERINVPGTVGPDNWSYRARVESEVLTTEPEMRRLGEWLAKLTREGGRAPP